MSNSDRDSKASLISLVNASFGYGDIPVIHNISLDVVKGEFIGLIGPNGSGKSTLFKGMLKLLSPLEGQVIHAPEIAKRIGYVPQRDQLDSIYPLSAFDVAYMGPIGVTPWFKIPSTAMREKTMESLERVGMKPYAQHSFSALSGGQRQRVLIARALAVNPQLLVLDEPTAGIDPVAEESILSLLAELNERDRISILMVSHQIQSLRKRVRRVLLIKDHKVLSGSARDLLNPDRIAELLSS